MMLTEEKAPGKHPAIRAAQDALDVTIRHRSFDKIHSEMLELIGVAESCRGAVIPLLGPTRCGKTEILRELRRTLAADRASNQPTLEDSFAMGKISTKPADRDLYLNMLQALGYGCGPRERTNQIKERLITAIKADGIRYLALDECSHCAERGANLSARGATDHFKTVIDETGIVLILTGLPKFQKLINENEQFRDRSLKTLIFRPYDWRNLAEREGYYVAFLAALKQIESCVEVAFDKEEAARRVYAVTAGRVGLMMNILTASLELSKTPKLTMASLAKGAAVCSQDEMMLQSAFAPEQPSDALLAQSYKKIMQEAELRLDHSYIELLELAVS